MQKKQITRIIAVTLVVAVVAILVLHLGGSFLGMVRAHLSGAGM